MKDRNRLRVFSHEGPGRRVGSFIVVVAPNMRKAKKMINDQLDSHGLTEELYITVHEIETKCILSISGDY